MFWLCGRSIHQVLKKYNIVWCNLNISIKVKGCIRIPSRQKKMCSELSIGSISSITPNPPVTSGILTLDFFTLPLFVWASYSIHQGSKSVKFGKYKKRNFSSAKVISWERPNVIANWQMILKTVSLCEAFKFLF